MRANAYFASAATICGRVGPGRHREVSIVLDVRQIALAGLGQARCASDGHVRRADELALHGPGDVAQRVGPSVLGGRHPGYPFFFGFGWAAATFPSTYSVTLATVTSAGRS